MAMATGGHRKYKLYYVKNEMMRIHVSFSTEKEAMEWINSQESFPYESMWLAAGAWKPPTWLTCNGKHPKELFFIYVKKAAAKKAILWAAFLDLSEAKEFKKKHNFFFGSNAMMWISKTAEGEVLG